jgi:hypothetical protein
MNPTICYAKTKTVKISNLCDKQLLGKLRQKIVKNRSIHTVAPLLRSRGVKYVNKRIYKKTDYNISFVYKKKKRQYFLIGYDFHVTIDN